MNIAVPLRILHCDAHVVAVDKPSGMLVHRIGGCRDREVVMQALRNQLGSWVYPVHRLDRGTSGVLLLARDPKSAAALSIEFRERRVEKRYLALVRGWTATQQRIDAPVREPDRDLRVAALTELRRLAAVELPHAVGRYASARYSLVELRPRTGRTHQLRLHLAHVRHPIVGDVRHGDGRHNRLFRAQYQAHRLMLCAVAITFTHPASKEVLTISTPPADDLRAAWERIGVWPVTRLEGSSSAAAGQEPGKLGARANEVYGDVEASR